MSFKNQQRIIVGISGATGITYGVQPLKLLRELRVETHLVITSAGERTRVKLSHSPWYKNSGWSRSAASSDSRQRDIQRDSSSFRHKENLTRESVIAKL